MGSVTYSKKKIKKAIKKISMIKFKRYSHKKANTCKRLEEKKNKSNC